MWVLYIILAYIASIVVCGFTNNIIKHLLYYRFLDEQGFNASEIKKVFYDYYADAHYLPIINIILTVISLIDLDSQYEDILGVVEGRDLLKIEKEKRELTLEKCLKYLHNLPLDEQIDIFAEELEKAEKEFDSIENTLNISLKTTVYDEEKVVDESELSIDVTTKTDHEISLRLRKNI